jgi:hypothetical protein
MVRIKSLANSQVEGKELEETLVQQGEQLIEGGEEVRVIMRVHEQGETVGETRYSASCRIDLKGILGSGKLRREGNKMRVERRQGS